MPYLLHDYSAAHLRIEGWETRQHTNDCPFQAGNGMVYRSDTTRPNTSRTGKGRRETSRHDHDTTYEDHLVWGRGRWTTMIYARNGYQDQTTIATSHHLLPRSTMHPYPRRTTHRRSPLRAWYAAKKHQPPNARCNRKGNRGNIQPNLMLLALRSHLNLTRAGYVIAQSSTPYIPPRSSARSLAWPAMI